jgi:hypothetical protein
MALTVYYSANGVVSLILVLEVIDSAVRTVDPPALLNALHFT